MHCIRPFDGWPAAALLSQLFTALGLPPDSNLMMVAMSWAFIFESGMPAFLRIVWASAIHLPTWPPTVLGTVGRITWSTDFRPSSWRARLVPLRLILYSAGRRSLSALWRAFLVCS